MKQVHIMPSNTNKYKFTLTPDRITIKTPDKFTQEQVDINTKFLKNVSNVIVNQSYRGNKRLEDNYVILRTRSQTDIIKINL